MGISTYAILFLKKILNKPFKKLPLYPEMNEFNQTSFLAYKDGKTVKKFYSFLPHPNPLLKEMEYFKLYSYCISND